MLYNKTWMTEYLLTVNFCQTKFLLIELKKQLPKYITPPPACNVNVIPENILPLQTKFHFSHILLLLYFQLCCISPYLDSIAAGTNAIIHYKLLNFL